MQNVRDFFITKRQLVKKSTRKDNLVCTKDIKYGHIRFVFLNKKRYPAPTIGKSLLSFGKCSRPFKRFRLYRYNFTSSPVIIHRISSINMLEIRSLWGCN